MIRFALLFSVLAAPLAAQTAISERPGRWISVPNTQAPVLEAPASGPLITAEPAPRVTLTAPEETSVLITPLVVPETRPVPRPVQIAPVAEAPVVEVPVVAVPEIVVEAPVAQPQPAVDPIEIAAVTPAVVPNVRPTPRPETDETVALAEALAAQIAAEARTIVTTTPRDLPLAQDIAASEALPPVRITTIPEVAARTALPIAPRAPVRVATPPAVVPVLTAAFAPATRAEIPLPMSAVLLPARADPARPVVQPVAFMMPPLETTPILPRLSPSGPAALEVVVPLEGVRAATLAAVLLPSIAERSAQVPHLARSAAPAYDPFPMSALPPSALPDGPDSLTRTIQPPRPFAEANAAVLAGRPSIIPARLPIMAPLEIPAPDVAVTDPDASVELPAPDPNAVARMMDDAMICWRLATLGTEAQWARLSVDVALDETNMPAAASIRLTGFARVVSGAAEEAYRAAHAALMGCAEATARDPVTSSATLVFDRNGVHLQ